MRQEFNYNILENPNTGSIACNIYLTNADIIITGIKSINSNVQFFYTPNFKKIYLKTRNIINNTNYFFRKFSTSLDYESINFYIDNNIFYGTSPNIRWSYDNLYEMVNFNRDRRLQIPNILYPEVEQNLYNGLINNSSTNIIIGDRIQNKSINLDYTLNRGSGYRQGSIKILCDSSTASSVYKIEEYQINDNHPEVDNSIIFSTDISGNFIRLNISMDNFGVDASLNYSITRSLRIPVLI
jgi:hypothetical protein